VNYTSKDVQYETSLMAAVHFGAPFSLVKKICDIGDNNVLLISWEDKMDAGLRFTLIAFRDEPSIDILRFLVENGGRQDIVLKQDTYGWTALHVDFYRDSPTINILRFLVENAAGQGWRDRPSCCLQP